MELKVGDTIEFKIDELVKGGFVGYIDGREVFLPKSLSGLKWDKEMVGKVVKAKVKELKENSIVADRKAYLREVEKWLDTIQGQKVIGVVKAIKPKGMVIDIDGVSGFVPKEEIFYRNIRIEDYFEVGDEVEVVLVDKERRIFSIKRLLPNPWEDLRHIKPGDILEVAVSHITDSGLFVELENGIEGFMHISEVNWDGENDLNIGDRIDVEVLEINPDQERLKVSRKRLLEKPAQKFSKKYKEGDIVEGTIVKFISVGAFVDVDGISVLLPNRFVSYKKGETAEDLFQIGEKAQFKVISIEPDANKVVISRKDVIEDPYTRFEREHRVGDQVEGVVRQIADFGIFVDLGEVEALVRNSDYQGIYQPGDNFTGEIIELRGNRIKLREL
ncbi:MAG: RNA-binding protein [Epsilonproteobacteria bacterium]|jgi:small subunit ribosomal protein S1|nr:RNA-binding protein [Campylobacterota bacterium]NPA89361.1 S1 RNA-binding domain-containing protein [Campylobacterota bacterium]